MDFWIEFLKNAVRFILLASVAFGGIIVGIKLRIKKQAAKAAE